MKRCTRPVQSKVSGQQHHIWIGKYIAELTAYVIRWRVILEGSRIASYVIRVKS